MARIAKPVSFARAITEKRESLAEKRKELNELEAQAQAFAPAYAVVNAIIENAQAIGFAKHFYARPSTWLSWTGNYKNELHISIEDTANSLKDGAVPALLEAIGTYGFEAVGTHDYALEYCASRVYRFTATIGSVDVTVRVEANIADGSESCKKVQTGVKLEEVAQYEIVCS
jgi:hypothetical protein